MKKIGKILAAADKFNKKYMYTLLIAAMVCFFLTSCKSSDYKDAEEYKFYGHYEQAIEIYKALDDYKDSRQLLVESIVSYINTTSGKESPENGLELLEEYRDILGKQEYYDCVYSIAESYCKRGIGDDSIRGVDLFGTIPQDHRRYKSAQKNIEDYRILSVSPFIGNWFGVEYSSAVEHNYDISVLISLEYSYGFELNCITKVTDETGYVWVENRILFGADSVTESELGNRSMRKHFKLWEDGRLWEYDNNAIYSLERIG